MRQRWIVTASVVVMALGLSAGRAHAQAFTSGSTGADGAFSPTTNTTLTLPPSGVFNFTTINIPSGVTVRFARNAANTPVTMLATGDVTIAGAIDISGGPARGGSGGTIIGQTGGLGGPGGFDGGLAGNGVVSSDGGAGLGPGGGAGGQGGPQGFFGGGSGGYATAGSSGSGGTAGGAVYGSPALIPLIGGSGGGGGAASPGTTGGGGGGGGGALLIASSGSITFTGTITAQGGAGGNIPFFGTQIFGGGGSGGAVRLVANTVTGTGTVNLSGGRAGFQAPDGTVGGVGRLRIEAATNTATINLVAGVVTTDAPAPAVPTNAPSLRVTAVGGVAAPAFPTASFLAPDVTLPSTTTNPVTVNLAAANIPLGTTVAVTVKGAAGSASTVTSTGLAGTLIASTATASVTIPTDQPSVISATASFTLTAASGGGPVFVGGEEVERVRVTASYGGASRVAYITKSGREIVVGPGR